MTGYGQPPDDRYGVESHLERFAPLHTVVEALIDHLAETCDVVLEEGLHVAADMAESHVLAVVNGGLREFVSPPRRPRIRFERGMGLVRDMGQTVGSR